jgi:hypothetical protein
MTRLDWFKFVGCFAAGMVLMIALDYLFQWKTPGHPIHHLGAVTMLFDWAARRKARETALATGAST